MSATTTVEKAYRGISVRLATHYLEGLGGERVTDGDLATHDQHQDEPFLPARVVGDGWEADLTSEKVSVLGSVELTEVRITFAGDEDVLDPLVEQFGQKAMRAGG